MMSNESQLIINSSLRLRYLFYFLRFAIKQMISYGTVSLMTYIRSMNQYYTSGRKDDCVVKMKTLLIFSNPRANGARLLILISDSGVQSRCSW